MSATLATWTHALAMTLWLGAAAGPPVVAPPAQEMGGLDLSALPTAPATPAPAEAGSLDLTAEAPAAPPSAGALDLTRDAAAGPPFLLVPPLAADRTADRAAHTLLRDALVPAFGARPLATAATLEAMEREGLDGAGLQRPEAAVGLAEVVGAAHVVTLEPDGSQVHVRVYAPPEPSPLATLTLPDAWPLGADAAGRLALALLAVADSALAPRAAPPEPPPPPALTAPPPPIDDPDLAEERRRLPGKAKKRR